MYRELENAPARIVTRRTKRATSAHRRIPGASRPPRRDDEGLLDIEGQFRGLVEQNIAGVYILSDRGDVAYLNQGFARLLGYQAGEVCGRSFSDFVAPHDRTRAEARFAAALRGESLQMEFALRTRSGTIVDILTHASAATYAGRPALVGVAIDITDRRRHEAAEAARVRRAQWFAEASCEISASPSLPDGYVERFARELTARATVATGLSRASVWLFNAAQTELQCVDAYEAAFDRHTSATVQTGDAVVPLFEALQHSPSLVTDDVGAEPALTALQDAYLKPFDIRSIACAVIDVSGRRAGLLCLESTAVRHHWEADEIAFLRHLADRVALAITNRERRTAQEELIASYRLLAQTERIAGVGGWELDIDSGRLRLSEEARNLLNVPDGASLTIEEFYGLVHVDDRRRTIAAVQAALDTPARARGNVERVGRYENEFRRVLPDGSERVIHSRAEVHRPMGGSATLRGTAWDVTEARRRDKALMQTNRSLRLMIASNQAVVRAVDEAALMNDVARLVVQIGGFAFGWIGLAERSRPHAVRVAAAAGPCAATILPLDVSWDDSPRGNGTVGAAIRSGLPQVNRDTENNPALEPWRDALLRCGLRSSVALPLTSHDGTFGALALYSPDLDAFDDAEVRLLQDLANDLAYGIASLRTAAEKTASADRLRDVMENTVEVIAATLEARDPYTAGHQRRVAVLASEIARAMGCDEQTIRGVHFGALIHDIGKIQIPSELLSKPTRLSELEARLLETHTEAGFDILRGIEFPWPVAQMVLQHHERLDGSGYPRGLTGDLILKEARILAVADVVEAMSSHRPYRPSRGIDVALAEIEDGRGTRYDARAVDACLSLFREQGFTLPAAG